MWFPYFVTSNPRIAILPRQVASEVITSSISRGGWAVAIAILVLDIPVLIDVLAGRGILASLPVPLAALLVMIALIAVVGRRPRVLSQVVYIGGALACAIVFMSALLLADPSLVTEATFVVNRPAVVLVLLGPAVVRPLWGLGISVLGLILSVASIVVACLVADVPVSTGWGPFTSWAVYAAAFIVLSLIRASQASAVPDLAKLEEETRRMALESQFEQRAAAMVHDTVLGDLTAVMNATGELDDRARERFRADVATLKTPSWLHAPDGTIAVDERDAFVRNGSIALASEMQWRGLTVDLTGDNDAVVRVSREAADAVHAAVRACLENVLAHSGVKSALLVAGGTDTELTYMVIDHGVGFDPAAVPSDRIGLRTSVVARIEAVGGSVRIWSQPGSGTSVLISIPVGGDDDGPA